MTIEAAFLGMQGNMVPATFISRTVAESEADGIAAGATVSTSTDERRQCQNFDASATFLGIHCVTSTEGTKGAFESARIITHGVAYLKVSTTVTVEDGVGINADGEIGAAAEATFRYVIAGAQFDDAVASGDLVPVRLQGTEIIDLGAGG